MNVVFFSGESPLSLGLCTLDLFLIGAILKLLQCNTHSMRTSRVMTISLPAKLALVVERKSRQSGLARSELFRAAFLRYIRDEENEKRFTTELQGRSRRLGIRSESDIEKLVDSVRR